MTAETSAPASGGAGDVRERMIEKIRGYLSLLDKGAPVDALAIVGLNHDDLRAILAALSHPTGEGPCDLCAGQCRGHSLGRKEEWEPEPGSRAYASPPPAADAVPEGWVPISEARSKMRYMGAFKTFSGTWQVVGPGRVVDGIFCDSVGRWEPVSRVFHLPPADSLSARPLAATGDA